jgi:EmrB/QacA subfamily drug resistance transporter
MSMQDHVRKAGAHAPLTSERAPARRELIFAIVALALIMMSVDTTIVATALDTLQQALGTSINWAGWTITAYSFGYVVMLPVSGELSDRYGDRRVFFGSVVAFTLASLGCGLANNIYVLVALRALQAAGGAGFTPSATAIIVDHFGDERDRAVGLFGSIFSVGAMIGPIFGGLFVTYWTWRGIFFVNVPLGIAVVALGLRYIPRDHPEERAAHPRIDSMGMAQLGIGLVAGMLAASYLGERGASIFSPLFLVPSVLAIVALWAFLRHIRRSPHPFIAPHLIYGKGFGAVNTMNGLLGGLTSGTVALVPLYATERYGLDALDASTLLVAQGVAAIILSIVAALILRRTGYRRPLYLGGAVIIIGMVLLSLDPAAGISPYLWLAGSTFLVGAGNGTINPATRNAGLQLEPEHSSTLAALRSMSMQIGTIVMVTIATAILASSQKPGAVQASIFLVSALVLAASLLLVSHVPEHRGSW